MILSIRQAFTTWLDRLVRPEVILFGRPWPAFQVCGGIGLALAILLAMSLVIYQDLSPWLMAGISLTAVLILLGLTMATKIITGEERIINYHHQLAVLLVTALLLWLLGQPILPYLDATMLGVGLFIAWGRVGCLMMGCCHGRSHPWGVCYRAEHAAAGFTPYLVGVRLFPIQAVEALWVFGLVLAGTLFSLRGELPGTALVWYLVGYATGRFFYEFMRGDPERTHFWGFSEAQWSSISLIVVVIGAGLFGALPFQSWSLGAAALLVVTMIMVTSKRLFQRTSEYQLLQPDHIKEVAEVLTMITGLTTARIAGSDQNLVQADLQISCTSLGVQISAGTIGHEAGEIHHYALSYQHSIMAEETARTLARLILQLKHPANSSQIIPGRQGIYHLLIYPQ